MGVHVASNPPGSVASQDSRKVLLDKRGTRSDARQKQHGNRAGFVRTPTEAANLLSQSIQHVVDPACDSLGAYMLVDDQKPTKWSIKKLPYLRGLDVATRFPLHTSSRDTYVWVKEEVTPMRYFAKVLRTILKGRPVSNDLGRSDSKQTSIKLEVLLLP